MGVPAPPHVSHPVTGYIPKSERLLEKAETGEEQTLLKLECQGKGDALPFAHSPSTIMNSRRLACFSPHALLISNLES